MAREQKILQFAMANTADLYEGTFTFDMEEKDFQVSAGTFAIIKVKTLEERMKIEEFIESLK
jgi:hypothetical protein